MKELTKQQFHLRLMETENQKKGGQFMKSKLIQLTMCLVLIAGFSLSAAVAADESQAALKAQAKITQKEATKTALTKVPNGKIESAELEKEASSFGRSTSPCRIPRTSLRFKWTRRLVRSSPLRSKHPKTKPRKLQPTRNRKNSSLSRAAGDSAGAIAKLASPSQDEYWLLYRLR